MVPQPPRSFSEGLGQIMSEHRAYLGRKMQARFDAACKLMLDGRLTMDDTANIKTLDDLGEAVGLDKQAMAGILKEVRENHALLRSCTRHQFKASERVFGKRAKCVHCGGTMTCESISWYEGGVEAGRTVAAGPTWIE